MMSDRTAHPHILYKTAVEITAAVRTAIENLYGGAQPKDADDVWQRYHTAKGMLMAWSEICFDMGVTPLVNVAAQDDLETLVNNLDNVARTRVGMPLVGQ